MWQNFNIPRIAHYSFIQCSKDLLTNDQLFRTVNIILDIKFNEYYEKFSDLWLKFVMSPFNVFKKEYEKDITYLQKAQLIHFITREM